MPTFHANGRLDLVGFQGNVTLHERSGQVKRFTPHVEKPTEGETKGHSPQCTASAPGHIRLRVLRDTADSYIPTIASF